MAAKIGTGNILFRVGSGSPSKVFLGTAAVQTVPGVAAIDGAGFANGVTTVSVFAPTSDGGSAITSYVFDFDGVPVVPDTSDLDTMSFTFNADYSGQVVRARAVNAVGTGPYNGGLPVS